MTLESTVAFSLQSRTYPVHTDPLQSRMKRLFLEGFSVLDVAEALPSFDADAEADDVRTRMIQAELPVIGVRREGIVVGYALQDELANGTCGDHMRQFTVANVVGESASLQQVIECLDRSDHCFVSLLGQVAGVVTRGDMQKPPIRMWLFGVVTIIELQLTQVIELNYPDGSWTGAISRGRLKKAEALRDERLRRREPARLIDCLQFADKAQVVLAEAASRETFGFTSKRDGERAMKDLQSLRNNLAHAQDIVAVNWDAIVSLSRRLDRIMARI